VVAEQYRKSVFLPGLRVAATILVDGFVSGAWKVENTKDGAVLSIQPFTVLTPAQRHDVEEEGLALLQFIEPQAKTHSVRWKP
jgi:hypothetical protein